ncbi:hypothetical protein ACJBU6_03984 [Exserohilum turcicum]
MASGYGLAGGPSRCFPFWQEVLACYTTNTNAEDDSGKAKCAPILEDYYECLHHKKEVCFPILLLPLSTSLSLPNSFQSSREMIERKKERKKNSRLTLSQAARTLALQAAYRKAEANIKRDDAPSAGEIRRLGVLDAPLQEKNLKPSKWFPHKEIN